MEFGEALITTSFIPAFLSFSVAIAYWRYYRKPKDERILTSAVFLFWGICYVLAQLRLDWFISNQILFFRNANVLVMFSMLYPGIKTIFANMRKDITATNEQRNPDDN